MLKSVSPKVKYNFAVLGESRVGKTSIIAQFMFGTFNSNYQPSIGNNFSSKELSLDEMTVSLHILDPSTIWMQDRTSISSYILGSSAGVIVFDVADRQSFIIAHQLIKDFKIMLLARETVILVGNKADEVEERCVTYEEAAAKARELGVMYIEVSAKTGKNIKPLFTIIAWSIRVWKDKLSKRD